MQAVQVRMARAALKLSPEELAKEAHVSAAGVQALEDGGEAEGEIAQSLNLFFATHGIELIDGDGVRARRANTAAAVTVDQLTTGNDGGQG